MGSGQLLYFEEGCQMESLRAFSIIHKLSEFASDIRYIPEDIIR
jgi:two-component system chemotaxis sensor kinase CheA